MQKQEEITSRLKQIFDLFLRENFLMTDNVYFEKLISHLQAKGKCCVCVCVGATGGISNFSVNFAQKMNPYCKRPLSSSGWTSASQ